MSWRCGRAWVARGVVVCLWLCGASASAQGGQEAAAPTTAFRGGGDLGFGRLEENNYWVLDARFMARLGPLRTNLQAPLRFRTGSFAFRTADYDDARDWAKVPRCVRLDLGEYTAPEDRYDDGCEDFDYDSTHLRRYASLRLFPLSGETLGEGGLVDGYRGSLDLDRPDLGVVAQTQLFDWGEARYVLGNIAHPGFMAGRAFIRPPNLFFGRDWDNTPEDVELGFTWAADVNAPLHRVTAFDRPVLDSQGDALFLRDQVHAVGADFKWMQTFGLEDQERANIGLFLLGSYNRFLDVDDSDGLHVGARFVLMHRGWDLRVGGEYRWTGRRYIAEYFDADYLVRSKRFGLTPEALNVPGVDRFTTLLEYRRGLPGGHIQSVQAYLSLKIPVSRDPLRTLPIRAYFEDATGPANATFSVLLGPVLVGRVVVAAQYLRRNFDDVSQTFEVDGTLIRILGRWYLGSDDNPGSLLNKLVLGFRYDRRFFQDQQGELVQTDEVHLSLGLVGGG